MNNERPRKPFRLRKLSNNTKSPKWRAGTRRNRREKSVPSFSSDRAKEK